MSLTVKSIASSGLGSEYIFRRFLNDIYTTDSAKKSNSSLLADAYRKLFYSKYYTIDEVLEKYKEKINEKKETQKEQEKEVEEENSNSSKTSLEIANEASGYEMDKKIPENSTVSYHV